MNWWFQTVVIKILESLEQQGDQTSQSLSKSALNILWKDWHWSWNSNPLAIWCEEPTHWKRLWCWERLRQEEKGLTEGYMVGWYHWLNGHEFKQTPEGSEGQGSLVCCSPWGCKELDVIERLNNNDQYSCLKNPMDRGAWRATVHRVAELDMTEWWACMHAFYIE